MPKIAYVEKTFLARSLELIDLANEIVEDYENQGYDLTLRQLYYQMVARDVIENSQRSYDRLGSLISDARLAGRIDWNAITDRTRNLRRNAHWKNGADIIHSAASSFATDKWRLQKYRPEVWVEKDALVGVIGSICTPLDVPYFSCRGYTSLSEMWTAGQRIKRYAKEGFKPVVFHLGDHDPSGMDMTRDIIERLHLFAGQPVRVHRLALNWDQIQLYNPPPNPAKISDSRAANYIADYGESSWELDALSPTQIANLIQTAIHQIMDPSRWEYSLQEENAEKERLRRASTSWKGIVKALDRLPDQKNAGKEDDEYESTDDE